MEVVLALLVIITVILRAVSASKKQQEQQAQQTQQAQRSASSAPKGATGSQPSSERSFGGVNRPNAEGYRQKKAELERKMRAEDTLRTEDTFVSTEGSESTEGKCIEPNANHCAVEHEADSVYATEITDKPSSAFTREDMVKGIVMATILSKPKWME